jgi:hypothetical protein
MSATADMGVDMTMVAFVVTVVGGPSFRRRQLRPIYRLVVAITFSLVAANMPVFHDCVWRYPAVRPGACLRIKKAGIYGMKANQRS